MRRQQDAPGAPGDVIRLDGVTKAYQAGAAPALSDVTMSVAHGEVAAITGPSGSGKSTLLNLIAGLDRPTSGTVTVAGQRIDALGESALARFRARHVGIIFQFFNLLDDLTVEDNVLLPARLAGASRRRARALAAELLTRLGIEKHRDHYPARLSGGGQFYVIAIALIGLLSLMVAVAAGLGVLNTVLMTTRDRVHDLGIFIPASFTSVFPVPRLALLSLAAIAIAVLGALLPAAWAARSRPATALRAE